MSTTQTYLKKFLSEEPSRFSNCLFERESLANDLTQFLLVERKSVPNSLVVTLNAHFGDGKTTFFRMWLNDIADRKLIPRKNQVSNAIYINAWESDFIGDPLVAILEQVVDILKTDNLAAAEKLRKYGGAIARTVGSMGNDVLKKVTGVDPGKALKAGTSDENKPRHPFTEFSSRKKALTQIKQILKDSAPVDNDTPMLIVIDELDRCRPNYAVDFLETIKHVFDIPGLIFVIGTDLSALKTTCQCLFGDMNFDRYYRKFSHRTVDLNPPELKSGKDSRFITHLLETHLGTKFIEKSHIPFEQLCEFVTEMNSLVKLNPRDLEEAIRIAAHSLYPRFDKPRQLPYQFFVLTIYLAILKIGHKDHYSVYTSKKSPRARIDHLKNNGLLPNNQHIRYCVASGSCTNYNESLQLLEYYIGNDFDPQTFPAIFTNGLNISATEYISNKLHSVSTFAT